MKLMGNKDFLRSSCRLPDRVVCSAQRKTRKPTSISSEEKRADHIISAKKERCSCAIRIKEGVEIVRSPVRTFFMEGTDVSSSLCTTVVPASLTVSWILFLPALGSWLCSLQVKIRAQENEF